MGLVEILPVERINTHLTAKNKTEALRALADLFASGVHGVDPSTIYAMLLEREKLASTGVGSGVAIPHARVPGVQDVAAALAVHPQGVPFDSVDGQDVHIFVAVLASERQPSKHLKALASISRLLRDPAIREQVMATADPAALHAILANAE